MGRIFKTPADNATEETLRAIHLANTVDTTYERAWGWLKTILAAFISGLVVSSIEFHNTEFSFYESTIEWVVQKLSDFANWLKWW